MAFLRSSTLFGLMCLTMSAQGPVERAATQSSDQPRLSIQSIAGENVRGRESITLNGFDEGAGIEIEVDTWARPENSYPVVFVHARGSLVGRTYGDAVETGLGHVIFRSIPLGEGVQQIREYVVQVGYSKEAPSGHDSLIRDWTGKVVAPSESKRITILRREVVSTSKSGIIITSFDGRAADSRISQHVEPSATIAGTWEPNSSTGETTFIGVAVHAIATDRWRIIGHAELSPDTWLLRDAPIAELGETRQSTYEVVAFKSKRRLDTGYISGDLLQQAMTAAAPAIRVNVSSLPSALPFDQPEIRLTHAVTTTARRQVSSERPFKVGQGESIIEFEGTAARMPISTSIWVALIPVEGNTSVVEGPALAQGGDRWIIKLSRIGVEFASKQIQAIAFVSTRKEYPPTLSIGEWHASAVSTSVPISIAQQNDGPRTKLSDPVITITRIGGKQPAANNEVSVPRRFDIEGTAEGVFRYSRPCVGLHYVADDFWTIHCSAVRSDESWSTPTMDALAFSPEGGKEGAYWELVAFASERQPPQRISLADLSTFAPITSQIYRLTLEGSAPSSRSEPNLATVLGLWIPSWPIWLALWLLLAEYLFRFTSTACRELKERTAELASFFRRRFPDVEAVYGGREVFGVALIVVGIVAMFLYFPLYRGVVQGQYGLSSTAGRALAIMLIIFNALAGVLFEVAQRMEGVKNAGRYFVLTVLFSVMACGWLFQAQVYFQYYLGKSGNEPSAIAMGLAAFFISAIESGVFFAGARLGGSLPQSVILWCVYAPLRGLEGAFGTAEKLFLCVPGRLAQSPAPSTMHDS